MSLLSRGRRDNRDLQMLPTSTHKTVAINKQLTQNALCSLTSGPLELGCRTRNTLRQSTWGRVALASFLAGKELVLDGASF